MVETRDQLHQLVDELPAENFGATARALRRLRAIKPRPSLEEILARVPSEPLTEDDRLAIAEARADVAAGRVYSDAEIRRDLGLP